MLSFLCRFIFLGKVILNNVELKLILNRIVVEACAPLRATLKAVGVSDVASSVLGADVGAGAVIVVGEGADLKAGDRVLHCKDAAGWCSVELGSVDILKIDEISAVVCDE